MLTQYGVSVIGISEVCWAVDRGCLPLVSISDARSSLSIRVLVATRASLMDTCGTIDRSYKQIGDEVSVLVGSQPDQSLQKQLGTLILALKKPDLYWMTKLR